MRAWLRRWLGVAKWEPAVLNLSRLHARETAAREALVQRVLALEAKERHIDDLYRIVDGCLKGLVECSNDIARLERDAPQSRA
jgi:hypothetical protein